MNDIKQMAIDWATNQMKQVREVELEQAKWHERHPEEPYVPGGIKACYLFQRDAFYDGERAALQMVLGEINRMAVEQESFPALGLIKFIKKQLSLEF